MAYDADPDTGVAVYDSYNNTNGHGPWEQIGGTSLAPPSWAGLIAIANQGRVAAGGTTLTGPSQTLAALYSLPASDYNDVTSGSNGAYSAHVGYDEVTGLGSPKANLLIPALASIGMSNATQMAVTSQPPSSVAALTPFSLSITVESSNGLIDTSFNGSVSLALATNPGGATLGGTLTVTAQNGLATFTGLTLNKVGAGYTLQATSNGLTAATTHSITVTASTQATQLAIASQPPSTVTAGSTFGLTIAVENSNGTINSSFNGSVTISLATNPGRGVLGGTLTATALNGMANFAGLTRMKPAAAT